MEPVLTPEEMRAADAATIAAGTPGEVLMDRAAAACATSALRMLGGAYGRRVTVLAGRGNNGGDGIACARHLALRGVRTSLFLLAEPSGDARLHLERLRQWAPQVEVAAWSEERVRRCLGASDLAIDAIFGTGFRGVAGGVEARAIELLNGGGKPVLAIDIPSGVSGADGSAKGLAVRARRTVAIQALKAGHVVFPGAALAGAVEVADVGIAVHDAHTFVPTARDVRGVLPPLHPDTHKYEVGALGVLAGSAGMCGAAVLVARAAVRAGAGLVVLGVPKGTLPVVEAAALEAVKVGLPERDGHLDEGALDAFLPRLERCRALALGPGLGRGGHATVLTARALASSLPLVVDADGLWALAGLFEDDPAALAARRSPTVLTPHGGEFALLEGGVRGGERTRDRIAAVREAARRWRSTVHLKGRRALTASEGGTVWVNPTGNPGAATGGTGDVLTGVVGAFLARGLAGEAATWAGAYLHGCAADVAAARLGRRSLRASDLIEALPSAFNLVDRAEHATAPLRTVLEEAS